MTLHKIEVSAATTLRRRGTVEVEIPDDVDEFRAADLIEDACNSADLNAWTQTGGSTDFDFETPGEGRLRPLMAGDLVQVITVDGGTFWRKTDDGWEELPDYTPATINGI